MAQAHPPAHLREKPSWVNTHPAEVLAAGSSCPPTWSCWMWTPPSCGCTRRRRTPPRRSNAPAGTTRWRCGANT